MNFIGTFHSKLPAVGTTIFTVMSALARENNAVNLSQGYPDFNPHPLLQKALQTAVQKGFNQYAPMAGLLSLREKIAAKTEKLYGAIVHPETEITITAGGTQAIFTAIACCIRENDEVILFAPAYDSYAPAIELLGGKPVFYNREAPDFAINWQLVQKLVNGRTRLIIINTPHNPTATVLHESDLKALEKMVRNTNILVLSDEVYEHILFDDQTHHSVLRYPALAERSFVVSSFGKTYHTTGWKVGYCIAPQLMMEEFRKVHQFNVFSVNTPAQVAYDEVLPRKDLYLELRDFYAQKRNYFRQLLRSSRFDLLPCEGTYFQLASYASIIAQKDVEFVRWLTTEKKVATIPISVFYRNGLDKQVIRFCFAKENSTLEKAAEILCKI